MKLEVSSLDLFLSIFMYYNLYQCIGENKRNRNIKSTWSKKDITRVFDAETIILGVFSGVLGGHIPAKMASKKDAVEALRSE